MAGAGGSEGAAGQEWERQVQQALEWLHFPPLIIHVALVLAVCWIAALWNLNLALIFTLSFAYLYHIESRQRGKIEARIRSAERRSMDKKRLLSDAETARWLNNVVECIWPVFLERFASEHLLMRIAPWFLEKYKPWTAKKIVIQQLNMGRTPPVFSFLRAGRHPTDGDHLVLEMSMNLSAGDDMFVIMGVQLRRRLGLGIWTSFHISNVQVEGKVKVGVRFRNGWPVIERLRICFSEAPTIRMVAKPISSYGVDVTDLPGIAAWLDKMIVDVMEQSLVEPNVLVVDVEKLVGEMMTVSKILYSGKTPTPGNWYDVKKMSSVATLWVEILEANKLKACDPNGLSDPYVKIELGSQTASTSIRRKTLSPAWHERFSIPITSWDLPNVLVLRVLDKDRFVDDKMGFVEIHVDKFKDGQRHEKWLQLDGVKTGQLKVALTVKETSPVDGEGEMGGSRQCEDGKKPGITSTVPVTSADSRREVPESIETDSDEILGADVDETPTKDEFETVDVGAGKPGCVSIVNPGREVVGEADSRERLRQRKKGYSGLDKNDRQSNKSGHRQEELDGELLDLSYPSPVEEVKHSRISKFLGRRGSRGGKKETSAQNVPGEFSEETNELVLEGNKGTKVRMELALDEDDIEGLEPLCPENETGLVPGSGELHSGQGNDVDQNDRWKTGRGSMRKVGRGMIKQAAHNIGHAFKRSHSDQAPNSLTDVWPNETSASFKQNEALGPNKHVEFLGAETISMQPEFEEPAEGEQVHNSGFEPDLANSYSSTTHHQFQVDDELAGGRLHNSVNKESHQFDLQAYEDENDSWGEGSEGLQNTQAVTKERPRLTKAPQVSVRHHGDSDNVNPLAASHPPTRHPPPPP